VPVVIVIAAARFAASFAAVAAAMPVGLVVMCPPVVLKARLPAPVSVTVTTVDEASVALALGFTTVLVP
jgi:hypothetical protein